MGRFRLKGCAKCGGDLVVDELDWLCLQCGTYYYTNLYQRRTQAGRTQAGRTQAGRTQAGRTQAGRTQAEGEEADGPLYAKEKFARSRETATGIGLALLPSHLGVDPSIGDVTQTANVVFAQAGASTVLCRAVR